MHDGPDIEDLFTHTGRAACNLPRLQPVLGNTAFLPALTRARPDAGRE